MANTANITIELLDRFSETARTISKNAENVSKSFETIRANAESSQEKLKAFGKSAESVGKNITKRVGLPVMAVGGLMLKTASEFESGMMRVKAVGLKTEEDFLKLRQSARDEAKRSVFTGREAADAQKYLTMAGQTTAETIASLPATLNLAAAGQIDLGRAADITTNIMSVFSIQAEDTSQMADKLAFSTSRANTNVLELGEAFTAMGMDAANIGVSFEQANAMLSLLANRGKKGGAAGTALKRGMINLRTPTGQAANAIKAVGLELRDSSGNMRDFFDIMQDIKNKRVTDAFHDALWGAVAAGSYITLIDNLDEVRKEYEAIKNESGDASENMALISISGVSGSVKLLKSALEELSVELFDLETMKFLSNFVISIRDVVAAFTTRLTPGMKKAIALFATLAVTLGPIIFSLGKMVGLFLILTKVFAISVASPFLIAFGGIAVAITAAVAAITLFSGGAKDASKTVKDLAVAVDEFGNCIPIAEANIESLAAKNTLLENTKNMFKSIGSAVVDVTMLILELASGALEKLWESFKKSDIGSFIFQGIRNELNLFIDDLTWLMGFLDKIFSSVSDFTSATRDRLKVSLSKPTYTPQELIMGKYLEGKQTNLEPVQIGNTGVPMIQQHQQEMTGKIIIETKDKSGTISSITTQSSGSLSLDTGSNMRGISG